MTYCVLNLFLFLLVMHPWPSCNGCSRNAVSMSMSINLLTQFLFNLSIFSGYYGVEGPTDVSIDIFGIAKDILQTGCSS